MIELLAFLILVATCTVATYVMFRGHANPVRCPYCGVLHGNHAINCAKPYVEE